MTQQIDNTRYYKHGSKQALGFGRPLVDRYAKSYDAIRGREQQLIDYHGGIGNKKVANKIRGVAKWNPAGRTYHQKANKIFGNIAPYTGY